MRWRWDQGRMGYFDLEEVITIARALMAFNGHTLPHGKAPDTLRAILKSYSTQPFSPQAYTVWRNYKRVFGVLALATEVDHFLVCTDICKQLASGDLEPDDYLIHIAKSFYYPSPVFEDYTPDGMQIFPLCAIAKLLIAKFITKGTHVISIDEIIDYLKGNNVTGDESIDFYTQLKKTGTHIKNQEPEYRQIREMVRFISQLSFLKWENSCLILDVTEPSIARKLASIFSPISRPRKERPSDEILLIGCNKMGDSVLDIVSSTTTNPFDIEFTEGERVRQLHLRVERSSKLRELYFTYHKTPHLCDMCSMDTYARYPWIDRLVELHHLLPLAAPVRVEKNTTSLRDIVGLCPACHRSTHKYYTKWLREYGLKDFVDISQAREVYNLAKSMIVL